ncbi:MAG: 16S rRNA (adenine(1518)-N(6)/adenine(1519)-N(6))-dimethyltransferase RsmA [Chloroflexota bacterium]
MGARPLLPATPGGEDIPRRPVPAQALSPDLSPSEILRRLGARPRKGLSQSFLADARVAQSIADAAHLTKTDQVLEIGPGLGILTRALAGKACRVVSVEIDRLLASRLPELVPANVEIICADALTIDPGALFNCQHSSGAYKVVANLPYHISSPIIFRLLDASPPPSVMVLMLQREVAERLAAPPGKLSYLGAATQSVANVELLRVVSPGSFYPRPAVDSAVIRLTPLDVPTVPAASRAVFLKLLRDGFTQPRKQLANSLAQGLRVEKTLVLDLLKRSNIDPGRRPQELALDDWRRLFTEQQAAAAGA